MNKILLSNTGKYTIVDNSMYDLLNSFLWHENDKGYVVCKNSEGNVRMHRLILMAPPELFVDHINMNKRDNRLENLRLCTARESSYNRGINTNNKTGFKGVSCNTSLRNKYVAKIYNNKSIHLGCFSTAKEAAIAYNEAAKNIFGEFANLNIIENN